MTVLAEGFRVRLRDDVGYADGGRLLVGGSPVRAVRLGDRDRARALLAGGGLTVEDAATARLARRLLDGNLANPLLDEIEVPLTELTVVVPVRDRTEQLARCLAALVPLPVIVVDDASERPHLVAEVAHRHGAQVHRLTTNLGPAGPATRVCSSSARRWWRSSTPTSPSTPPACSTWPATAPTRRSRSWGRR